MFIYIFFFFFTYFTVTTAPVCYGGEEKKKPCFFFSLFFFLSKKTLVYFFFLLWDPDFAMGCSSIIFSYLSVILSSFILLGRAVFLLSDARLAFSPSACNERTNDRSIATATRLGYYYLLAGTSLYMRIPNLFLYRRSLRGVRFLFFHPSTRGWGVSFFFLFLIMVSFCNSGRLAGVTHNIARRFFFSLLFCASFFFLSWEGGLDGVFCVCINSGIMTNFFFIHSFSSSLSFLFFFFFCVAW